MTNDIPAANNTWTLMKHFAGSLNKGASKIDQKVYGKIEQHSNQTVIIQQVRPAPVHEDTNVFEVIGAIVVGLLFIGVLIAFVAGKISTRDVLGL